jgi:adenylosuccinate synthase
MKKSEYIEQYYKNLYEKLNERAYLLEKMLKKKVEKLQNKKKLDPVGKEDEDVDNDGKPNTSTDKYIKNRRAKIKQAMMKKKKVVNEGTIVTNGEIFYGGFPKIVKEETDGEGNWEQFIGLVNTAKREYFNTLPGKPGKRMMPSNVSKMLETMLLMI